MRRLLNQTVTFEGEFVQVRGIKLVVHGNTGPRNADLSATGPKMLELSGEIADGVVLNYPSSRVQPEAMDRMRPVPAGRPQHR